MSKRSARTLAGVKVQISAHASPDIHAAGEDGQPATFSMLLYAGGPIRPGGWNKPHPLVLDLSGMSVIQNGRIPFNRGHKGDDALVGHGTAQVMAGQLHVNDGVFSFDNEHTQQIISSSKSGFKWGSSMEATLLGSPKFVTAGKSVRVNGQQIRGPVYVARKSELFAGAFIGSNPADRTTEVSIAASEHEMPKEVKDWLEGRGIDCEGLNDDQIAAFSDDYNAIHASKSDDKQDKKDTKTTEIEAKGGDGADLDPVAEIRAAAVAETQRISGINKQFGERFPEIKAACLADGEITIEAAKMKFDRADLDEEIENRPSGPAIHASSSEDLQNCDVYAAALHQSMDLKVRDTDFVADVYGEKNAELAKKLPRHAGLQYLCYAAIRAAGGYVEPGIGMTDDVWQRAIKADRMLRSNTDIMAASSFSTFSLTDTLSNVAHKFLMRMYRDYASLVDRVCSTAEHSDFKQHTKVAVEGDLETLQLPKTGEIKHGTLSDSIYTNIIYTWARMLSVTRPDFFNDDLGAFQRNGLFLGRGAMKSREKLMWLTILNPALVGTFWKDQAQADATAADTQDGDVVNRVTGGTVSTATLDEAELLIKQMNDETGDPIVMNMDSLLTGTVEGKGWERLLVKKTTSVYDANQAAGTARTELRIEDEWMGRIGHLETPWMDARHNIPGSADNLRFLLGDKEYPAFEYARLRGEGSPNIDSSDTDFNTLGFQSRVYWDYGFKEQNPRGMIRIES